MLPKKIWYRVFGFMLFIQTALTSAAFAGSVQGDIDCIKSLDRRWTAAINRGNADDVAMLFAEDGRIFQSGVPEISGRSAIRDYAASLSRLPNLSFETEPTVVDVASSGDLAYLTGRYSIEFGLEGKKTRDVGKYLVVWRKQDGDWFVAVDTFSSDQAR